MASVSMETWVDKMKREHADVKILTLVELRALPECGDMDAGIYFLWRKNELLYIGKSRQICHRLLLHDYARTYRQYRAKPAKCIPYDRHTCIIVESGRIIPDLNALKEKMKPIERAYIAHYQPPFNYLGQNPGT